ncbi:MAG: oxygenase MpaB family protein [Acidimicrobiales bacterium]
MTTTERHERNPLDLSSDAAAEEIDPIRLLLALISPVPMREFGEDPYGLDRYASPAGDPGIFGPGSVVWRVHADLPALLYGGHASLLLQSLHPRVMAGVTDHSDMTANLVPRLIRTARFVLWTTFGSTELAESLIERVRLVHDRVRGRTADGRPYSANEPSLLTFVHVAEVWGLLRAYQRYSTNPLLREEKDRYLQEMTEIAIRLGARDVPQSVEEVREYFTQISSQLEVTDGSRLAYFILDQPMSNHPLEVASHSVIHATGLDLLPGFAQRIIGREAPVPLTIAIRAAAMAYATAMRTASGANAIAEIALQRAMA